MIGKLPISFWVFLGVTSSALTGHYFYTVFGERVAKKVALIWLALPAVWFAGRFVYSELLSRGWILNKASLSRQGKKELERLWPLTILLFVSYCLGARILLELPA